MCEFPSAYGNQTAFLLGKLNSSSLTQLVGTFCVIITHCNQQNSNLLAKVTEFRTLLPQLTRATCASSFDYRSLRPEGTTRESSHQLPAIAKLQTLTKGLHLPRSRQYKQKTTDFGNVHSGFIPFLSTNSCEFSTQQPIILPRTHFNPRETSYYWSYTSAWSRTHLLKSIRTDSCELPCCCINLEPLFLTP